MTEANDLSVEELRALARFVEDLRGRAEKLRGLLYSRGAEEWASHADILAQQADALAQSIEQSSNDGFVPEAASYQA